MVQQDSQQDPGQKASKSGMSVAASPFNSVKLELGFALFFGIILWLAVDFITHSFGTQLLLLVGYGVIASLWLVTRTRQVLRQHNSEPEE
jgi:hypothetical protein